MSRFVGDGEDLEFDGKKDVGPEDLIISILKRVGLPESPTEEQVAEAVRAARAKRLFTKEEEEIVAREGL